jgi:8-oxo-dGTP pyrophosphatase MutT (NUDIX family)
MTPVRVREETSAGGVVYRIDNGTTFYLLIRDSYKNWGFPKGHLENDELPQGAAVREVSEETGLCDLVPRGLIDTIDWHFRFRGRLIHKVCHFFLMETAECDTSPQRTEGITACRWLPFEEADALISYANARDVLRKARAIVLAGTPTARSV